MRLFPPEEVERFLDRGWWSGRTLDDYFCDNLSERRALVALVDAPNRADFAHGQPRRLTWDEVGRAVDGVGAEFLRAGLHAGEVVGVQLPNIVELAIVYLAAMRLGVIVSPFPVQYREHEVVAIGGIGGFAALVTAVRVGGRDNAAVLAAVRPRIPTLRQVFAFGDPVPHGVIPLDPALDGPTPPGAAELAEHRAGRVIDPNDCVTLCWTSGTEASPKGVPRAHGDWLAVIGPTTEAPALDADSVLLCTFPMVNAGGVGGMYMPWVRTGCRLVMHHPFDLDTMLGQLESERITHSVSPPAILSQLLLEPERMAGLDLSSLRTMGSGSTAMPAAMIAGWEALGVEVINFFGSNEGLSLTGTRATVPDPAERGTLLPRPGEHGLPTPVALDRQVTARLIDLETGSEIVEVGRPGEMRLKGPYVFSGYWGGGHEPFDDEGWFRTGDVFEYAGDRLQFVRFLGRSKDLIVRGGFKISAADLEDLVLTHPSVAEVAAVGAADPILGERVCLFVVPRHGHVVTLDLLIAHLRAHEVATFKLPERLEVVPALPRSPIGKVLKRELRSSLAATRPRP